LSHAILTACRSELCPPRHTLPEHHAIRLSALGTSRILTHERSVGAFRGQEGKMRAWGRLTGLVAGFLLVATQASAQALWPGGPGATSPLVPGQLFVGFGAQIGVYHLPKFDSPWRSSNAIGVAGSPATDLLRPSIDPDPTVAGPGGVFGYVFRDGTFPTWAGRKVRLSFGGQYWEGNFTDRQDRSTAPSFAGYFSVAPIDASPGFQTFFNGWSQRQTSFNVDANGYHLALRLTSDFAVAPRVTVSPFISLFGGQSRESYAIRARIAAQITNGVDGGPYALDERVATARVGALVGTGVTYRVVPRLSLHLGVQAGLVWLRSHMTGGDCFANAIVPPGTPCGAPPMHHGSFQTTVSDTRSTVGFRGGLTGGVSWDMRFAVLSLTGFMTYDSQVPGIRNPVVTSPITACCFNQPTSGRAHLFFDDAVNFGGMVVLRIPLNAPHG
jgi:hypothetical protein